MKVKAVMQPSTDMAMVLTNDAEHAAMLPGIHRGLDIDAYHAGPGISHTGLNDIARSPAHYNARHRDPQRPPRVEKAGWLEGHLAHCATVEPEAFGTRYVVGPDVNRNTKIWKEFVAANASRIAIQPDQYDTAMRQAESVRALPDIREALAHGQAEVSAYWTDEATGVLCRCRPDWVHSVGESGAVLLDLKTCGDASPQAFVREIARKRYHVQDAFYSDGYARAAGVTVYGFVFVAVECEWPYAACAVMLDDDSRRAGYLAYRRDLDTYASCLQSGAWPGYGTAIELVTLPAWVPGVRADRSTAMLYETEVDA